MKYIVVQGETEDLFDRLAKYDILAHYYRMGAGYACVVGMEDEYDTFLHMLRNDLKYIAESFTTKIEAHRYAETALGLG